MHIYIYKLQVVVQFRPATCMHACYSGAGDHDHLPAAHPSRMSRPTPSPAAAAAVCATASAWNSLARIRTVTRCPGGTSAGGGVHGCTAGDLASTSLLKQDGLDAQLPMDVHPAATTTI